MTEREQLGRWAPFVPDRDLDVPGEATFTTEDGSAVEQSAGVVRSDPPSVLEYRWEDDLIRWDLEPTTGGTHLTLRHTHPERDWLPKIAAGWHLCLVVVDRLLDGRPIPRIVGDEAKNYGWQELANEYAEELKIPRTEESDSLQT